MSAKFSDDAGTGRVSTNSAASGPPSVEMGALVKGAGAIGCTGRCTDSNRPTSAPITAVSVAVVTTNSRFMIPSL